MVDRVVRVVIGDVLVVTDVVGVVVLRGVVEVVAELVVAVGLDGCLEVTGIDVNLR